MLKWQGEPDTKPGIKFSIEDTEECIIVGGSVRTLANVLEEKWKTDPSAGVCYNKLIAGDEPGFYKLEPTHLVKFVFDTKADESQEDSKCSLFDVGSKVPAQEWETCCTGVVWHMRWTTRGLQPAKPQIITSCELNLPAGRAVRMVVR